MYDVTHQGNVAQGICGIVPKHHKERLSKQGVKVNSLKACEIVYSYYLDKNNGNKILALKQFKGIKSQSNMYLVYRVLELEKKLK